MREWSERFVKHQKCARVAQMVDVEYVRLGTTRVKLIRNQQDFIALRDADRWPIWKTKHILGNLNASIFNVKNKNTPHVLITAYPELAGLVDPPKVDLRK